jgi:hypothetical protein
MQFNLPKKCGWFYILQLSHNKIWGFGITVQAEARLRKGYCNPSCSKQEFWHMYYGDINQITDLENHLKSEWSNKMHVLFEKRLEWFDPKHNLSGSDIKLFCDERIIDYQYNNLYSVKAEHLPYSPGKYFKYIKNDPGKFLEPVTLSHTVL